MAKSGCDEVSYSEYLKLLRHTRLFKMKKTPVTMAPYHLTNATHARKKHYLGPFWWVAFARATKLSKFRLGELDPQIR